MKIFFIIKKKNTLYFFSNNKEFKFTNTNNFMILILIIKNLFFLLKNCLTLLNLIKKKEIYYLILLISINLFILPSIAYCETESIEKTESDLSLEEQQKRSKLINNICLIIFGIAFLVLWWNFLGFIFGYDEDFYDSDSSSDELPEVKPKTGHYTQGTGYHFFVRDVGIRYDDNLYSIPEVDVTTTNLYDPKDGPVLNAECRYPKYTNSKITPFRAPLETIPEAPNPSGISIECYEIDIEE